MQPILLQSDRPRRCAGLQDLSDSTENKQSLTPSWKVCVICLDYKGLYSFSALLLFSPHPLCLLGETKHSRTNPMVNTLIPVLLNLLGGLCTTPVHAEDEEDEGEMTSWISSPRTPILARLAKAGSLDAVGLVQRAPTWDGAGHCKDTDDLALRHVVCGLSWDYKSIVQNSLETFF